MVTITLEFNMVGSVFQDLGLGTLTPNMDDQIGVGMEREVAGQTMSTECQVLVKIFCVTLIFELLGNQSLFVTWGGGGVEGFSGITWFLWGNGRVIIRRQQSIKG